MAKLHSFYVAYGKLFQYMWNFRQTKHSAEDVRPWLEQLKEKGVIRETSEGEGKVGYTRVTQDDTALHVVKQMPTIHSNAQPTIAIITANYCEKLAMDAMILNKTTYVRYTTIGMKVLLIFSCEEIFL